MVAMMNSTRAASTRACLTVAALLLVLIAAPVQSARPVERKALETSTYKDELISCNYPSSFTYYPQDKHGNYLWADKLDLQVFLSIALRECGLPDLLAIKLDVGLVVPDALVNIELKLKGLIVLEVNVATAHLLEFVCVSPDGRYKQVVKVELETSKSLLKVLLGSHKATDSIIKVSLLDCFKTFLFLKVSALGLNLLVVVQLLGGLLGVLLG